MIRAGILSDTHLQAPTDGFRDMALRAFAGCDVIFHAGDITDMAILDFFDEAVVHAVHGNMCSFAVKNMLPESKKVELAGQTIALCHGAGLGGDIEGRLWSRFPEADCIIYGHTHRPVCERKGGVLFINPGSFRSSSVHGEPASYVIAEIDSSAIAAKLHYIRMRP